MNGSLLDGYQFNETSSTLQSYDARSWLITQFIFIVIS